MLGGVDPGIPNLVTSDVEIRRNHFYKPLAWKGQWLIQNLFESNTSQRVLIEGNVFENNWQHGQGGAAILLKSSNATGICTWRVTQDITIENNLIRNVGSAFS